ncbi:MAG: siderophore-interacting protein [Polyangiales bacterium]
MSGKGMILRWLGAVALREATVTALSRPAPRFLRVRLRGGVPRGEAGDKVQLLLPGDDVRTYTPFAWADEGEAQGFSLLVFLHGDTPATRWARALQVGATVRFVGPQRALRLPEGPLLVVGDETSLAVAASYAETRPGQVEAVLEGDVPEAVLADLGIRATVCAPGEAAARVVVHPGVVGLTGSAALIQRTRDALAGRRELRVKAHWIAGRAGID